MSDPMTATPASPAPLRNLALPALVIVALTLAAYAPALSAGFIWDDDRFLTENPLIHAPDGLYRFWFTTEPPDYFPLTSTVLWLEWRLWGMNATGYHVVNVLLHALSAVLLWRVLARLAVPGAWLGALLFALHPVAVASAAWITEGKNTIPMVFYLGSILAYLRCIAPVPARPTEPLPSREFVRWYSLSILLFLLALLAKTSVVVLPMALLLCTWWLRGTVTRRDLARTLPFFALALALGLVTVWYQYHSALAASVRTDSLAARAAGAGWAVWFYLYKAVLPVNLCFVYPRWTTSASPLSFAPAALLAGMLLLFVRFRHSWGRPLLFAFGYYLLALAPVLGFLNIYFMRYSLVADHWQYLALGGITALVGAGLAKAMERPGAWRAAGLALAASAVLICGSLTWLQAHFYQDVETLWRVTIARNPDAWMAYNNLGGLLVQQAETAQETERLERLAEAQLCFERVLELQPNLPEAYNNRASLYLATGRTDEAIADYDRAIALKADYAEAYYNRAQAEERRGNTAQALSDYGRAVASDPTYAAAWHNRGLLLGRLDRPAEALADLDRAVALRPDYALARFNRANALAAARRFAEAVADYTAAIRIAPDYAAAYCNRAIAWRELNDYPRARADIRRFQELGGRPHPDFLRSLEQGADRRAP